MEAKQPTNQLTHCVDMYVGKVMEKKTWEREITFPISHCDWSFLFGFVKNLFAIVLHHPCFLEQS